MNLTIKALDGGNLCLLMDKNDTVYQLKLKIENSFGFTSDEQKLIFRKQNLNDNTKKLIEYGISDNEIIYFSIYPSIFKVTVYSFDGRSIVFEMKPKDSLSCLKLKINNSLSLAADDYILLNKGIYLEKDESLLSLGITDDFVVNLLRKSKNDELLIFVKSLDGTNFQINISQHDKVSSLKTKIYDKNSSLLPKDQKLVFQGGILEDIRTLADYNVNNNSVINVVTCLKSGNIQIFIKLMDGRTINIDVMKSDTIRSVKNKIQEKLLIAADEQKIVFQGGVLQDDGSVEFYGIENKSLLYVVERRRCEIQIEVKTLTGEKTTITVKKSYKIIDVKKMISDNLNINPMEQKLVFQGGILEDDRTVDEYGITKDSVINVVQLVKGMEIFVKILNGQTISLNVSNNEKILDLKNKIQDKLGISPNEQKLVFQGGILENDKTVNDYRIYQKCVVNVVIRLK